jgi:hypothetical protein
MPTFHITGPDGKSYNVTGDTPEGALQALQQHIGTPAKPDTGNQHMDAGNVFVDEMLFGLPGKAASAMNAAVRAPFTDKSFGEEYGTLRDQYQNSRKEYATEHPVANTASSIAGSIYGGVATGSAAGNVLGRVAPGVTHALQSSYGGRMAADAAAGLTQGGLSAYGHDQDIGTGALIGGVAGGLARPVMDAGGAALRTIGGLVGVGNEGRAQSAIASALSRSGQAPADVANDLGNAVAQGQPQYTVADALGNSGQRMLTGVARSPGDMRQTIAETLQNRQAGQGERLVNALSEGFDAPTTANQARTAMTTARDAAADVNYEAARQGAGTVDPSAAIQAADNFLTPGASGVMNPGSNIADDSIESAVRKARSYLTDGNSVLSDFNAAFRAKNELDGMIQGAKPAVQRQLIPIRNALDDSLASASQPYSAARDQFRQQSQAINAVDQGAAATSARSRAADNIDQFQGMPADQQQAFRQGYADPYIARVESASASPSTNKARMLITEKTGQEFPAFAAPGRGDILGDRIAREQRMFETANAALGGSRTADNAADMADIQGFDPTMISAFATGGIKGAALHGLQKGINAVQGRNSQTRDMIARMLLQGDPTQAAADLSRAVAKGTQLTRTQEALIKALIGGTATAPSRLMAGQ